MPVFFATVTVGLLIAIMGIINMTGNISTLHSYHRKRVSEEDKKSFGRAVGLGTLLCGLSYIFFGCMFAIYELTEALPLVWVGVGGLLAGMACGIVLSLRAIIKYNKGLF